MPNAQASVAAVDLGASSGRVVVARVQGGREPSVALQEVHRFGNGAVDVGGTLHWDILRLHEAMLDGLAAAARGGPLDSVGIDSWAVDYGLLDADGALLGNPVHYRDHRTDGVLQRVLSVVPAADLYDATGLQLLPFSTLLQLVSAVGSAQLAIARQLLLVPDLLGYWLSGERVTELTNASTTQLLDVRGRVWHDDLLRRVGIERSLLTPLVEPGTVVGGLTDAVVGRTGASGSTRLVAVGSHDTASAVVGVPASGANFAYISCGTWSLVGVELDRPVLTEASREADFTNELGVDGTVRYLRNVMGLWLLQECQRTWSGTGAEADLATLLAQAAAEPALGLLVDPDDPTFLPPGDMPARITQAAVRRGERPPRSPGHVVRCILDSLALTYRRRIRQAQQLSGGQVDVVHLVGGGTRNTLLCQLTADACGLPVLAGPVEAAALGNALVQGRAVGVLSGGLAELRRVGATCEPVVAYRPQGDSTAWDAAERRVFG